MIIFLNTIRFSTKVVQDVDPIVCCHVDNLFGLFCVFTKKPSSSWPPKASPFSFFCFFFLSFFDAIMSEGSTLEYKIVVVGTGGVGKMLSTISIHSDYLQWSALVFSSIVRQKCCCCQIYSRKFCRESMFLLDLPLTWFLIIFFVSVWPHYRGYLPKTSRSWRRGAYVGYYGHCRTRGVCFGMFDSVHTLVPWFLEVN